MSNKSSSYISMSLKGRNYYSHRFLFTENQFIILDYIYVSVTESTVKSSLFFVNSSERIRPDKSHVRPVVTNLRWKFSAKPYFKWTIVVLVPQERKESLHAPIGPRTSSFWYRNTCTFYHALITITSFALFNLGKLQRAFKTLENSVKLKLLIRLKLKTKC